MNRLSNDFININYTGVSISLLFFFRGVLLKIIKIIEYYKIQFEKHIFPILN